MPKPTDHGQDDPDEIDLYFQEAAKKENLSTKQKSGLIAFLLWFFTLGVGYRLYMGDWGTAAILAFVIVMNRHFIEVLSETNNLMHLWIVISSGAIATIIWIYDLLNLSSRVARHNQGVAAARAAENNPI